MCSSCTTDPLLHRLPWPGSLIDEHQALFTVITLVVHERRSVGRCVPAATWNRELDILVDEQLEEAREILGSHGRPKRFVAVEKPVHAR
jgi:hypothetical protein